MPIRLESEDGLSSARVLHVHPQIGAGTRQVCEDGWARILIDTYGFTNISLLIISKHHNTETKNKMRICLDLDRSYCRCHLLICLQLHWTLW